MLVYLQANYELVSLCGNVVSALILRDAPNYKKYIHRVSRLLFYRVILYIFAVLNSSLLHLPPLRFHCVGGC
jgi:hypothetical protein